VVQQLITEGSLNSIRRTEPANGQRQTDKEEKDGGKSLSADHQLRAGPQTFALEWQEDADYCDAKDVFYPSFLNEEAAMSAQVPLAFERAGYTIRAWRKADTHPHWSLSARRKTAPKFDNNTQFVAHVIEILKSAGIRARKADVTIDKRGEAIQVSFLWPLGVRRWRFNEKTGWEPDL